MYFFFFQRVPAKESPASNRTWLNSSRRTWLLSWSIKLATIQTGTALNQYLSAHISPYMGEMRERKKGVNYWSIIDLYSFLYAYSIAGPDYNLPPRERVAKWQLQQLDTNRNNVIDRQETRELRLLFKRSQKLRRCSKKLPAFCDTNGDKRITADEWLQCVGVVKGILYTTTTRAISIFPFPFQTLSRFAC